MTRKQALLWVLERLYTYDCPHADPQELKEITAKLEELAADLPLTSWSENAVFDAIDDWIAENGRVPTTRDLSRKGLPPIPVLKRRFAATGREFLDRYYPGPVDRCCSKRYASKSAEEWKRVFTEEYQRVGPCTAREYNLLRSPDHPAWSAMARILGTGTWRGLLSLCGLQVRHNRKRSGSRAPGGLRVSRRVDTDCVLAAGGESSF